MSKTNRKNETKYDSKKTGEPNGLEPGNDEFNAYDEAVRQGPPLDSGVRMTIGGRRIEDKSEGQSSVSPGLSGGDVDAAWEEAELTGDEAAGTSLATPDQDVIDGIGHAIGLEFQDDEELRSPAEGLEKRDHNRWELDRRSADDADSLDEE